MNKICTKCKIKYPVTVKYFPPNKQHKDGLQPYCRKCKNKAMRKYYQTEQGKETMRKHQQTECHKKYQQKYFQSTKGKIAVRKYCDTIKGYLRHKFAAMKRRCINPEHISYKNYGERGIKLKFTSDEFVDYVVNILKVDPRGLQIDRINNNGHYEKGNIQFITHKENNQNKRKRKCREN